MIKVNQKYEKYIKVMTAYDSAIIGSDERRERGIELDRLSSKLSDRDKAQLIDEYNRYLKSKCPIT